MDSGENHLRILIERTSSVFSDEKERVTEEFFSEPTLISARSPSQLPKEVMDLFALTSARRGTKALIEEEKELRKQLLSQRSETHAETPYVKIMKRCSALQRDLSSHWTEAASSITARRSEWVEAKHTLETAATRGPWKGNAYYSRMRKALETRIARKTDPAKEMDKEVVLRLVSTATSPDHCSPKGYVSLSDMTPRRLEFLSKARRGFGKRPLSMQELVESFKERTEKKWGVGPDRCETAAIPRSSDRIVTEPAANSSPKSPAVNEFILKQRDRFMRNKVSKLNIERKQALEAAMQRIHASAEVARKASQLQAREVHRKVKFLRKKAFKLIEIHAETPIEQKELKEEIVNYRKNVKDEITMGRRVRKSILLIRD